MLWIMSLGMGSFFLIFIMLGLMSLSWVIEWKVITMGVVDLSGVFIVDFFSFIFLFIVIIISSMIFIFSKYYMDQEKHMLGFSLLLLSFVGSMMLLITSPNLFTLLLGWDGLGLTSYLLVVYYSSAASSNAGMVTFLTNRLGDIFFLFSLTFFFFFFFFDFYVLKIGYFMLAFFMVLAFITKSAQIPFSSWLPAAMAAPTPVSSLVHSSTLVTAGIFLLIRYWGVVAQVSFMLFILSLMTLLMAGLMAIFEWDMKKLIALSTLSQLGFMCVSLSLSLVFISFFHLLTHALFKASLFMSSGVIIHTVDNSQEFRNLVGVSYQDYLISSGVLVCVFCLMGIPFFSGFFSKDVLLDGSFLGLFFFSFYLLGILTTVGYSLRFVWYIFLNYFLSRVKVFYVYETAYWLLIPIWVLILCSLVMGFFFLEGMFLLDFLLVISAGWKLVYMSLLVSVFFFFFFVINKFFYFHKIKYFVGSMWYLNKMVGSKLSSMFVGLSLVFVKVLDQGWMDFIGPQGSRSGVFWGGKVFHMQQNFSFSHFILVYMVFVSLFM